MVFLLLQGLWCPRVSGKVSLWKLRRNLFNFEKSVLRQTKFPNFLIFRLAFQVLALLGSFNDEEELTGLVSHFNIIYNVFIFLENRKINITKCLFIIPFFLTGSWLAWVSCSSSLGLPSTSSTLSTSWSRPARIQALRWINSLLVFFIVFFYLFILFQQRSFQETMLIFFTIFHFFAMSSVCSNPIM